MTFSFWEFLCSKMYYFASKEIARYAGNDKATQAMTRRTLSSHAPSCHPMRSVGTHHYLLNHALSNKKMVRATPSPNKSRFQ